MSLSADEPRLYGVKAQSPEFEIVWREILPLLEKTLAYAHGRYLSEDIYRCLKACDMQLWVIYNSQGLLSFCITQIIVYPRKKILSIPFVGGIEMLKWLHLLGEIQRFAKENGCDEIEGYAREGWLRVFNKFNFEVKKIFSVISIKL